VYITDGGCVWFSRRSDVVNPDNPSGTWHSAAAIERMIEQLPSGCLLIVDEAYHELGVDFDANARVAVDDLRVLRLRTFSKGYGLAGCRIGYALGALEIISAFDKIRNHFGINRISQAGALAALRDQEYLADVRSRIKASRKELAQIAADHGMTALPSATNFVTMDCGSDGAFARALLAQLQERDVFVRMPGTAPLDRCIRVSCGSEAEIDVFRRALPAAMEATRLAIKNGKKA
jgi:histidinol-phosphate aminotransferase